MKHHGVVFMFLLFSAVCSGQEFKVEYDHQADLSRYTTFTFGETEIITIREERVVADSMLHKFVREAVRDELERKGLKYNSSKGSLVVSYVTGSTRLSDAGKIGPLGHTPGSNLDETSYQHDHRQGNLYIDLNDPSTGKTVWHVAAVVNSPNPEGREFFNSIVQRGFRKFSIRPKKSK